MKRTTISVSKRFLPDDGAACLWSSPVLSLVSKKHPVISTAACFNNQRRCCSYESEFDSAGGSGFGGSDHYKDQFRPSRPLPIPKVDEKDYGFHPNERHRSYQPPPALKSNPFERSRTYGLPSSSSSSSYSRTDGRTWYPKYQNNNYRPSNNYGGRGNNNSFSPPVPLKPINWENETLVPFQKNFYQERPEVAARTVDEIKELLREHRIFIDGKPPIPKPLMAFSEAGFPSYIQEEIDRAGFKVPSDIQKISFPIALSGRDFIGVSKTGSGKTLAFILPGLVHIDAQPPLRAGEGPIVLVLAPTRELACQIESEAVHFGHSRQIKCAAVYGGTPAYSQRALLHRGAEVVVACPGRLLDFLQQGVTNLKRTTYLVLDEADRMLDMGFEPQIRQIVSQIRPSRQTLMYSATWPVNVSLLARDFCQEEPVTVKIGSTELHANPDVTQEIICAPSHEKQERFMNRISKILNRGTSSDPNKSSQQPHLDPKVLVFCSTRDLCERIAYDLIHDAQPAVAIHGKKSQSDRDRAMAEFKSGRKKILVATDVAARGLDITDVTAVVNYDLPSCIEDYVHRIGRTARAGKKGLALTFFPVDERSADSARMARDISKIMREAGQQPPPELEKQGMYR